MTAKDSQRIHEPIVHQHIHCPPFDDMSTVFQCNPHGICDCDDFCFAECLQDGEFVYFKTASFVIAFDELLQQSIESVDCVERRSNNERRKALYMKRFCALDFGVLESGERRRPSDCAVAKVRQISPCDSGYHMGFKEK